MARRGIKACPSTIRSECIKAGYNGRVARKKPFISKVNLKKRLIFENDHKNKGLDVWRQVIFSDESKFNIFGSDGRHMVWRKKNTDLEPKNLIPTVKHGGGGVHVWVPRVLVIYTLLRNNEPCNVHRHT